jgi:hypothetical protein
VAPLPLGAPPAVFAASAAESPLRAKAIGAAAAAAKLIASAMAMARRFDLELVDNPSLLESEFSLLVGRGNTYGYLS